MEEAKFGLTELYDCIFLATYDMKIGDKEVRAGEPVVIFDELQTFDIKENKIRKSANGGYGNAARVIWETPQNIIINFQQGVFSKTSLSFLGNSIQKVEDKVINDFKDFELDENKQIELPFEPSGTIVIYGDNIYRKDDIQIDGKIITVPGAEPYENVSIYYEFIYSVSETVKIGRSLFNGFLRMTAKTKMKDDSTGVIKTAVFEIPKLRLMSDFSIRLGNATNPAVGRFMIEAIPVGSRGNEITGEFIMLDEDLNSKI